MSIVHASRETSRTRPRCRASYRPRLRQAKQTERISICPFIARTWKARQVHAVSFVRCRDFDFGQFIERVQFRQTQGCEPVDHRRVPKKNEIEPTAPTLSSGSHAPLSAACLQVFADLLDNDGHERFDWRRQVYERFSTQWERHRRRHAWCTP